MCGLWRKKMRIGLDIGSTTIKCVVLDEEDKIIFSSYERHCSQIMESAASLLQRVEAEVLQGRDASLAISGSAGMGLADSCKIPFVQEVYATRIAADRFAKGTDVIIELGGEDAKILFLQGGLEVRMNGSCAGGTGAFIDQMATLLDVSLEKMDELALENEKIYTIASRCGVFAKSDIQPLLNQGARKTDLSMSIFYAVVNQTIAGLAQGRPITGKVLYLGGPLTFFSGLRQAFDNTLKLTGICPTNSLYFVAMGAAFGATETIGLATVIDKLQNYQADKPFSSMPPLFKDEAEYAVFAERHARASVPKSSLADYTGGVYLGIDAGSTTVKTVLIGDAGQLLDYRYETNSGNPVTFILSYLRELYATQPQIKILSSAVTGYGEEMIKNAFQIDYGVVETIAHFTAAKAFMPEVDFVIDIGGQDMKCFKIRKGAVDNIFLNEACSSGCGSFLQTFANAMGYKISDFAKLGLFAQQPVDLGSRCTVFMNSSVKQAQKDGASTENISAGLSVSVVKNAIYKVIRSASTEELGKHIVVQGGTFYNDVVLRAFEQELQLEVIRPDIAGLMGAYGAALYASAQQVTASNILTKEQLNNFSHQVKVASCGLCSNNCRLTINSFDGGRKFIGGNRCERPVTKKIADDSLNIYSYKLGLLQSYQPIPGTRGKIGMPFGLNLYELLPFWHSFFSSLGFEVVTSKLSDRKLYLLGQSSIPSDTVCFPAKLMHGHIEQLIAEGIEKIFYPCMSYNLDEGLGDNNYNCPVVAYYPEVIKSNMPNIKQVTFIGDYVGLHRAKDFPKKMQEILAKYFEGISLAEVKKATKVAYQANIDYLAMMRKRGLEIIAEARTQQKPIILLAGRPYHIDPEINHGIDKLIGSFGMAVVSEDVVSDKLTKKLEVDVLNQWTYHSRLYTAAEYCTQQKDMNFVQLVSFGCGVDAITTDECRKILEQAGKIYTQIKIDEITNLGAVKIRLRSLFAAAGQKGEK